MKKLIVIGIVAAMLMGVAVAAMATPTPTWTFDPAWQVQLRPSSSTDAKLSAFGNVQYGTKTGATDSPAVGSGQDASTTNAPLTSNVDIACYDLDTTASKRWILDQRAPLVWTSVVIDGVNVPYVQEKVWHLKLYAGSIYYNGGGGAGMTGKIDLTGWTLSSVASQIAPRVGLNSGPRVSLYLVDAWGGTRTLLYTIGEGEAGLYGGTTGISGTYHQTTLAYKPTGNTDQGTIDDPYYLELVAVPEPGSMLAMLSGLIGLVGFGIRRRK